MDIPDLVFTGGEYQNLDDDVRLPFTNIESLGTGSYGEVIRQPFITIASDMRTMTGLMEARLV